MEGSPKRSPRDPPTPNLPRAWIHSGAHPAGGGGCELPEEIFLLTAVAKEIELGDKQKTCSSCSL